MDNGYIFNLKQPCDNRGIELTDNKDGSVTILGNRFETMTECEDFLIAIPRKDIPND